MNNHMESIRNTDVKQYYGTKQYYKQPYVVSQ